MKKLLSAILTVAFAIIPLSLSAYAADSGYVPSLVIDGVVDYNQSDNDYYNYSYTVDSYLEELSDGYRRVCYYDDVLTIDDYDSSWALTDTKTISKSGYLFGGYYSGSEYNYLVWGQENPDEDDSKEVLRIEKYTKDWNTLSGYAQVFGANTTIPFDAGSLRMTETAGKLYIHTCHEMYANKNDGLNHQANMTFVIDTATMTVSDSWYKVMNISYGYVSHSFNQFILTDGNYIYRADHGDAYPRSVCITRVAVGDKITKVKYTNALPISGAIGDNFTGVTIGGFETSADNLLIAGSTADQSASDIGYSSPRNIFITVTDKNLSSTTVKYITDYTADDGIKVRTPHLVKINDNKFLVMWEELEGLYIYTKLATIDENGNLTSEITDTRMRLSDCKPVLLKNGLVSWYASDSFTNTVYFINPDDLTSANNNVVKGTEGLSGTSTTDSVTLSWALNTTASGYAIEKYSDGNWSRVKTINSNNTTSYTESGLDASTLYSYRIRAYDDIRQTRVWENTYKEITVATYPTSVKGFAVSDSSSDYLSVSWTKNDGASSYIIEQYTNSGWIQIADIKDSETVTYKVTGLTPGTAYKFRMKAYVSSGSSKAYSKYTSTLTANTLMTAVKDFTSPSRSTSAIRLSWTENKYADGYIIEQFNGSAWVQIADITDGTTVTYKVTGLKAGTAYKFRMKAYSVTKYGETIYGDKTATLTANTLAPSVSGLDLKSRSAIALRLAWEENTAVDGYAIEQYKSGKWVQIADIADSTVTEYKVTGLKPATTYKFRMRAYCITKYGDKAYSVYTDTLEKTTAPSVVTGLVVKSRSDKAIRLAWEQNTSAKGYIIEQYIDGKWVRVGKVTPNDITEYRIDGLTSGTTYEFRVKAYIVTDTSIFSNYTYVSGKTL